MTPYRKKLIEVALSHEAIHAESARVYNFLMQKRSDVFDKPAGVCYKLHTSPLFLRGQGARRSLTASAFLSDGGGGA